MRGIAMLTLLIGLVILAPASASADAPAVAPGAIDTMTPTTTAPAPVAEETLEGLFPPDARPAAAYPTPCDVACTASCQAELPGSLGLCTRGYCICF